MSKAVGKIKWFEKDKGYGYIIGYDEETYYFNIIHSIKEDEEYQEGDRVEFEPMFESELIHARKVGKVERQVEDKYDPETLFKSKAKLEEKSEIIHPTEIKEESIFTRIINKIKAFLKIN